MQPRQRVRSWVEAFNRADAVALGDFYAEDAINHQVAEAPVQGRAAIHQMFACGFTSASMVCIVENIFEEGEWVYAHLLSNIGRHTEAIGEAERARELDPLNLRTNALEAQFLNHAGRTDESLARLQKTFELGPNYYLAHLFAASAYIEKGMFPEAIAEAHKARESFRSY